MNKKGFTLVELILVVVILGIISAITIPSIMNALSESKTQGGESVEKLLETNLELYNTDHKEDIWCLENSICDGETQGRTCYNVVLEDLYNINPDIDFGDCVLQNDSDSLVIKFKDGKFSYSANIICSKDFKNDDNHILDLGADTSKVYYETKEHNGCEEDNNDSTSS
ncbi:MAG: type II secretion system protein [Bacilli bacterium]